MSDVDAFHELEVRSKPIQVKDGSYIGEVRTFATPFAPNDWLECDGRSYKIKDYPNLAKVIGNQWGSITKDEFLVPDLRGVFLRGWNHGRTGDYSDPEASRRTLPIGAPGTNTEVVGSYQRDLVGEHQHSISLPSKWGDKGTGPFGWAFDDGNAGQSTATTPTLGTSETRPRNAYVMFCIRAK